MRKRIRARVLAIVMATTSVFVLSGCTGSEVAECEQILEETVLTVKGVDSAEFTCKRNLGNSSEIGTIIFSVSTQQESTPIIEEIYRALAAEGRINDAWRPFITFAAAGGGVEFNDDALGFNGTPVIGDVRDRYDIHPPGTN